MKAKTLIPPLNALLIIGMLACTPPPVDEDAVREEITAVNQQFMDAFNQQDAEGVAGLYTANGMLLPPGTKAVSGRDAIQQFWSQMINMGPINLQLETTELYPGLQETWEVGMATVTDPDGNVLDAGPYVVGWMRVDGNWRLHRDIWNSNMPPPETPLEEAGEAMSDEGEEM